MWLASVRGRGWGWGFVARKASPSCLEDGIVRGWSGDIVPGGWRSSGKDQGEVEGKKESFVEAHYLAHAFSKPENGKLENGKLEDF